MNAADWTPEQHKLNKASERINTRLAAELITEAEANALHREALAIFEASCEICLKTGRSITLLYYSDCDQPCTHKAANFYYANHMIACSDCDEVIKTGTNYREFEEFIDGMNTAK